MTLFTFNYRGQLGRYLALFLMLILVAPARATAPAATGPGGSTPSLGQVLNPDGTLRAGASGSFDARAFAMSTAPDGRPVFRPTGAAAGIAGALGALGTGDGNWQDGFGLPGTGSQVTAMAVASNGDVYVGGRFRAAGTAAASYVARWNGTAWNTLGTGTNGAVLALAVSGTDVYAGGEFTTAGGVAAKYIAKWNGTAWSAVGEGFNNTVTALTVSGTTLYAGGKFVYTASSYTLMLRVARWDGSAWNSLGTGTATFTGTTPATSNGMSDGEVNALAVVGSNLYVGGSFTQAGGKPASGIAKWDGTAWSTLQGASPGTGNGVSGTVYALAASGTDLYVGGSFGSVGGAILTTGSMQANSVAKWSGSAWSRLGTTGTANGVGGTVSALAVSGTTLYVGGGFTFINANYSSNNKYLARWNGSTSTWAAVPAVGLDGSSSYVAALAVASNGDLYAGGTFAGADGTPALNIVRRNTAASTWTALGTGFTGPIYAVAVATNGDVYVGGNFTRTITGTTVAKNVAKWDGTSWSALGTGTGGPVYALAVSGTDLYVGGDFQFAGVSANRVAKWNGTAWSALGTAGHGGTDGTVRALAVSGSTVYVGGDFTQVGNFISASYVASWNATTLTWAALGSGLGAAPLVLAASGTDLYAGGSFTTAGGSAANRVAKWNGTAWSALGAGVNNAVRGLALSGSTLYASGDFTQAGGAAAARVAAWNGTSWTALGTTLTQAGPVAVRGTEVYVYGARSFSAAGDFGIMKWDGTAWNMLGSGLDGSAVALALGPGRRVVVGGGFSTVGDGSKVLGYFGLYDDPTAPTVTLLNPTTGPVNTSVTITGTDFTGATAVRFNGVAAPGFVVNTAGTQITVAVPAGATTGVVSVSTAFGTGSSSGPFTVTPTLPSISGLLPANGPVGTSVRVSGANFTGTTAVAFNGTAAPGFVVDNDGQLTVSVPFGASTGPVSVTAPGGTASSGTAFTVTAGVPPVVLSLSAPANRTYRASETLDFTVTFDRAVAVTGAPVLPLVVGISSPQAVLISGAGTATLRFRYTVAGEFDIDGIGMAAALLLNGGSITNLSDGAAANLTLNGVPALNGITVDGVIPYVVSSARLTPATSTATGPDVTFRVTFNEAVYGNLAPLTAANFLPVNTGGVGGTVSAVVAVAGQNNRIYDVTLTGINGEGTLKLNVSGASPIIQDGAGNQMAAAFTAGETYTIVPGNLLVSTPQNVTGTYANVTVAPGGTATLTGTLTVTNTFTVRSGGSFFFRRRSSFWRGTAGRGTAGDPCSVVSGAGDFVLEPGATLAICDPSGISLAGPTGAVQVTGTRSFSDQAHYVFDGDAAQTTGDGLPATVAGLTVANAAGVTLTNATSISGFLNLTNGDLTVPAANTLTINSGATATTGTQVIGGAGSFVLRDGGILKTGNAAGISALGTATGAVQTTTARTFGAGASYEYNGLAAQATGTGLPATIAGLTIDNAAGATLTNDLTATGPLALTRGVLTTGARTLTLASTATLAEQETSYVLGQVAANRPLAPGTTETFGGLGLTLAPAPGSVAPGTTLVTRTTGTARTGVGTSQSILRSFNIEPTTNTGLNVALSFAYFTHELNGIPVANLALFKSESGSAPWVPQHGTTAGPNVVTKTGITDFSVWTLGNSANPLPVELTTFTATPQGNLAVRLAWATASERNSAAFDVERSTNGHTFARLGTLPAAGSSSSPRHYELLDTNLPTRQSTIYYRLRQLDKDGTFSYSPVRTVALQGAPTGLALYPNPATISATLTGALPGAAVTLSDALGRAVASTLAGSTGTAVLALPAGLPSGVYVVRSGTHALRLTVE